MRKFILAGALLILILSACTGQATTTIEAPVSEPSSMPAQAAETTSAPAQAEPTSPPAVPTSTIQEPVTLPVEPAPAGVAVIYKIVPGESSATYEVGETFFNDNRFNLAVGRTPQVSGEVSLDTANPQNSSIGPLEIDISQFQSDSSRRDNFIRDRFLESRRFPIATFTPSSITGLPGSYTAGQELSFQVIGDLTVKETTKPVTFDVTAKLDGDTLTGTAVTTILLSEFGVGPIEIAGMLGTEDQAKLTLAFVARP
jgi:polyisoprenoid-binding protein YceI